MSAEKVMQLANHVFKSLRDYRILNKNESLYGMMKLLLDANVKTLNNRLQNTFYTLSGYAFGTYSVLKRNGGEKSG